MKRVRIRFAASASIDLPIIEKKLIKASGAPSAKNDSSYVTRPSAQPVRLRTGASQSSAISAGALL